MKFILLFYSLFLVVGQEASAGLGLRGCAVKVLPWEKNIKILGKVDVNAHAGQIIKMLDDYLFLPEAAQNLVGKVLEVANLDNPLEFLVSIHYVLFPLLQILSTDGEHLLLLQKALYGIDQISIYFSYGNLTKKENIKQELRNWLRGENYKHFMLQMPNPSESVYSKFKELLNYIEMKTPDIDDSTSMRQGNIGQVEYPTPFNESKTKQTKFLKVFILEEQRIILKYFEKHNLPVEDSYKKLNKWIEECNETYFKGN
ncbi:MAG: hypothetical protein QE271_10640 [Bacteriovoracaceae bacterium]|nr:hypothetical protein [Bacteriovoracaceae bacterium]